MQFDVHTLLIAVVLATTFCTGARILLWRMHPHVPGLLRWAWAGALASLALLLLLAQSRFPPEPSLSLAQALVVAGLLFAWDGFRRFLGRKPLPAWFIGVSVAVVLTAIAATHASQSITLRAATNSLLIASLSGMIARELLTDARPAQIALRATAWLYAVNAGFFLVRAVSIPFGTVAARGLDPDGFAAVPLFWWLCATVATTLGMVLMTSERLQSDLDRQASRDPLTGALNRRAFSFIVEKEIARARRYGQPLSVLMMDLDHFKQVNDRLGHGEGDAILREFVAVAERVLRGEDVFCRFGGEEFVAVLPNTGAADASVAAERLRLAFARESGAVEGPRRSLPFALTVSIGIGELEKNEDMDDVLRRADAALYRAKALGRNRCELAADESDEVGVARAKRVV